MTCACRRRPAVGRWNRPQYRLWHRRPRRTAGLHTTSESPSATRISGRKSFSSVIQSPLHQSRHIPPFIRYWRPRLMTGPSNTSDHPLCDGRGHVSCRDPIIPGPATPMQFHCEPYGGRSLGLPANGKERTRTCPKNNDNLFSPSMVNKKYFRLWPI